MKEEETMSLPIHALKCTGEIFGYELATIPTGPGLIAPKILLDYSIAGFEYYVDSYYGGHPVKNDDSLKVISGWTWKTYGLWLATNEVEAIQAMVDRHRERKDNMWITERAAKRMAELGIKVTLERSRTTKFTRTTIYNRIFFVDIKNTHHDDVSLVSDKHHTEDIKIGIWI